MGKALGPHGVRPNRGIAPGCSFATTLVKVYCIQPFDEVVEKHPDVDFDIYIDDLQMDVEAKFLKFYQQDKLEQAAPFANCLQYLFKIKEELDRSELKILEEG